MAEVNLKICMGTMCYIMGGAELRALVEMLPDDIRQHIDVTFSPCLGMCDKVNDPPFVELNGKILSRMSRTDLIRILKDELKDVV